MVLGPLSVYSLLGVLEPLSFKEEKGFKSAPNGGCATFFGDEVYLGSTKLRETNGVIVDDA